MGSHFTYRVLSSSVLNMQDYPVTFRIADQKCSQVLTRNVIFIYPDLRCKERLVLRLHLIKHLVAVDAL